MSHTLLVIAMDVVKVFVRNMIQQQVVISVDLGLIAKNVKKAGYPAMIVVKPFVMIAR